MECAESPKRCRIRVSGLSHSSGFQSPFQGLNLILSLLKEYKFRKVSRKPGNPGLSPKIGRIFITGTHLNVCAALGETSTAHLVST